MRACGARHRTPMPFSLTGFRFSVLNTKDRMAHAATVKEIGGVSGSISQSGHVGGQSMDDDQKAGGGLDSRRDVLKGLTLGAMAARTAAAGLLGGGALALSAGQAQSAGETMKMAFIQYQP